MTSSFPRKIICHGVHYFNVTIHMLLELDQPRKSVQFSEAVQVKTVEEPQEVEINEEKIDRWAHNDSLKVRDVG
jgi:hypothetical protein